MLTARDPSRTGDLVHSPSGVEAPDQGGICIRHNDGATPKTKALGGPRHLDLVFVVETFLCIVCEVRGPVEGRLGWVKIHNVARASLLENSPIVGQP